MPVLSDFSPQGAPGETGRAFIDSRNASESWMDRAQNRQLVAEKLDQAKRQSALEELERPVKEAQLKAQVIGLGAGIANQTRMEQLKGEAAAQSHAANNEFLDAMQLADFSSKANALAGLQAKYQWMSLIPEYKGFVDTINDERVKAHGAAIADAHMEEQLAASQTAYDRAVEVATIGAGARQSVAETNAGTRETVAETAAQSRKDVADTNAGARTKAVEGSMQRTEVRGDLQAAIEADKEALKFAQSGDEDAADQARKRAQQFRDSAKQKAAAPTPPVHFDVPGVTPKKLYQPPSQPGDTITISPEVRTPEQVIQALQQAVEDGHISADDARETLLKLGYKKKG